MGVAAQEQTTRRKLNLVRAIKMAMADKPAPLIDQQLVVGGCDGKAQQHLIHFGIAIAPHRDDLWRQLVEPIGHRGRVIPFRQRIARAMVEQIAEQQIVIRLPGLKLGQHPLQRNDAAVDVGNDGKFHEMLLTAG